MTKRKKPWQAKRVHPSIVEIDCDMEGIDEQWVLLRSDAHHDNPHSDHEREKQDLDEAIKRNAIILDIGDFFCAMGGRADPRRSRHGQTREEHLDAPDYFDSLVKHGAKFLAPYASHIALLAQGNHETAVSKNQETDLTARLVERINTMTSEKIIDGRYGGDVYFKMRRGSKTTSFWLHFYHGSGGGGMMSFDTLRIRRQSSWNPVASVIVCGHVHERWALEMVRKIPALNKSTYSVFLESQWHIRCGCYKDEYGGDSLTETRQSGAGGWHVERGGPPKPIGAMWMRIKIDRKQTQGGDFCRPKLDFMPT